MTNKEFVVPQSPRDIPSDATEADLRKILAAWIDQARQAEIPLKLFEIAWTLGIHVGHFSRNSRRHVVEGIEIYASSNVETFEVAVKKWNVRRRTSAFVGSTELAHWEWLYVADTPFGPLPDDAQEVDENLFYLPGRWIDTVLPAYTEAIATRAQNEADAARAARDGLAERMMVGQDI